MSKVSRLEPWFLLLGASVAWSAVSATCHAWQPGRAPLMTPFAADVNPARPHDYYPRPTLQRRRWLNLNGLWEFVERQPGDDLPFDQTLPERILVPFPVESALSGVMRPAHRVVYRRAFAIPSDWLGQRVLLHFGAVDWEATVYLNGETLGTHRGGYNAFSFDITPHLRQDAVQELIVSVYDPTDRGDQPRGRQTRVPTGMSHGSVTGIWQTVWLEPVPQTYVASLRKTPLVDESCLVLDVESIGAGEHDMLQAEARVDGVVVARAFGGASGRLRIQIPPERLRLWSPADPFLYDLTLTLSRAGQTLDQVESYFGMRCVDVAIDADGVPKIRLNGRPVFLLGVADQGLWPDGLYTAPTEEAMIADIESARRLGFSMIYKRGKVEPERFYYWCDRLGILVRQDMPAGKNSTAEAREQFAQEFDRLTRQCQGHPSIIEWVLFQVGYGQHDAQASVRAFRQSDPARILTVASGWNDTGTGDTRDVHHYPDPLAPAVDPVRASVIGSFGGVALAVPGHTWSTEARGYRSARNPVELEQLYSSWTARLVELAREGLSAAVYVGLTDVENEATGLLTYDRRRLKIDFETVVDANRRLTEQPEGQDDAARGHE